MKYAGWCLVLLAACQPLPGGGPAAPGGPSPGEPNVPGPAEPGPGPGEPGPGEPGPGGGQPQGVVDVGEVGVSGVAVAPRVLAAPEPPVVEAARMVTLAQQRSIVANARDPVLRQAQTLVLQTMLHREALALPAGERAPLWGEARAALRDALAALGGADPDARTLRALGAYELMLDDPAAAEPVWGRLIALAPGDAGAPAFRAWHAWSLLRLRRDADAMAALAQEPLVEQQPEQAYVLAWARWRLGDHAGAWQAMATAARAWAGGAHREAVQAEAILFASRLDLPAATVLPDLRAAFGSDRLRWYALLAELGGVAYPRGARWADSIAALDEALAAGGPKLEPEKQAALRQAQADARAMLEPAAPAAVDAHTREQVVALLEARRPELAACHERALVADPSVSGAIQLSLDVSETGAVVATTTEPVPGPAGLAAVAGCVSDHARRWPLPPLTSAGRTVVRTRLVLAPAAP